MIKESNIFKTCLWMSVFQALLLIANIAFYIDVGYTRKIDNIEIENVKKRTDRIEGMISDIKYVTLSNSSNIKAISQVGGENTNFALMHIRDELSKQDPIKYKDIIDSINGAVSERDSK